MCSAFRRSNLYSRFEEAIRIIASLLRDGTVDFHGRHFEAHGARLGPAGPRGGSIPIWIGARGPKMLRLAARWADTVNFQAPLSTPDQTRSLVTEFEEACRAVGRDPTTVNKTGWAMVSFAESGRSVWEYSLQGDAGHIAAQMHALAGTGISHLSCYFGSEGSPSTRTLPAITTSALHQFSDVIQALRFIESADGEPDHE